MGRKAAKKTCVKPKKAKKEKRIENLEPKKQRTKGNGGSTGYGTFVNVTLEPLMVAAGREGPKQMRESVAMEICEDCMDGRFNACGDDGGNVYVLAQQVHMFLMMRQLQRENGEKTQLTSTQKGLVEHLAKALTCCSVSLVDKVYYHTQPHPQPEPDTQTKCEYGPKQEDGPKPELPNMLALLEPNSLKADLESKMEMEWEPLVKTEGIQEEVVKFEGIIKEEEFVVDKEIVKQEMDELQQLDYCPIDALLHMPAA